MVGLEPDKIRTELQFWHVRPGVSGYVPSMPSDVDLVAVTIGQCRP
ncbi:hypothetical protein ZOSMA_74G01190 [Zostera marina]|uniref:Uncharacterized protein n=1 Tax=Zostera marina TaxID=29655 RepID=A0A0K9NS19_ZOSMR|nr:hypothetical protein ZOSMA_74G01190 [Zostera marina]